MVSDQLQVRGEAWILLDEIQQVVRAEAGGASPTAGEIFPYGNSSCAAGAHARLTLVASIAGAGGVFELGLQVTVQVTHKQHYNG